MAGGSLLLPPTGRPASFISMEKIIVTQFPLLFFLLVSNRTLLVCLGPAGLIWQTNQLASSTDSEIWLISKKKMELRKMDNEIKWANGRNECKLDDIETAAGPEMPREINRNVCKKKCVNFVVKMTETADANRSSRRWNLAGRLTFFCLFLTGEAKEKLVDFRPAGHSILLKYCTGHSHRPVAPALQIRPNLPATRPLGPPTDRPMAVHLFYL